ncbi:MAG: hypothetical protein JEZ09_21420 [Salinivirgaceae bacterium]|nr:hypothetical protein [Salinivirgaceae bacterium]
MFSQNGRFEGMGNSSVMLYDFWGVFNNQAGLAKIESPIVGICYDNGFLVNETGTQSLGFVLPTKSGNFNTAISRYGYSLYSENKLALGYSRKINDVISASLQFDYIYLHQSEAYENKGIFIFELGLIAEPVENLFIGVHLLNPTRTKIAEYQNERAATVMRFGLGYFFAENVVFTVEAEKNIENKVRMKSGLEYGIISNVFIRAGIKTNPNQFSLGLGYVFKNISIDISFLSHPSLPISSQASINYQFKK